MDRSYLSVVSWPAAMTEAVRVDALVAVLACDRFRAKELARRRTPAILARDQPDHAAKVERELRAMGVEAFAVPGAALQAHLDPALVRSISREGDALVRLTLDRGEPIDLDPKRLLLLVRAHARGEGRKHDADFGVAALHQLHATFSSRDWDQGHSARARVAIREVLDLHTRDGPHWRLVAGRCAIEHFADRDDDTGRELLDAVADRLAADARGIPVDRAFDHARFLAEFAPDFAIPGDWRSLDGFALYSAWVRHLAMARQAS